MPFSILSQGVETQMPTGVTFAAVPAFDGVVQIEQSPAVDAMGGSLQVVGFQPGGVVDLVYTAADGTTVEQTITLEGYVAGASYDTAPVAYGEDLDSFLLAAGSVEHVNQGGIDFFSSQKAYAITPTNSGFEATYVSAGRSLTNSQGADTATYLTPLGDGRVGWVAEDENGNEFQSGIIAEVDGEDIVVRLYDDTYLATDDGGVVGIRQTDTGDFRVQQYNADYQLLESEVLARADLLEQSGLDTQGPAFTFFVNDAGELDVYLSDPADPEGTIYKFEFDLVTFDPDVTIATEFSDQLILTAGDDVIDISLGTDTVFGLGGDDLITEVEMRPNGGYSSDRDVIYGGAGNDTILLDIGRDLIYGGDGNDYLDGGDSGQDSSSNSFGNTLFGDAGDDILQGGDRPDRLYGGEDDDTLFGGGGADTLDGGSGDDKLLGGDRDDVMHGGNGIDLLRGSRGEDSISGDNGADILFGGAGNDILKGGQGFDRLIGGAGDDSLYGGRGKDELSGGNGNDYMAGGSSLDTMRGGDGQDEMFGGDGDDQMSGGRHDDTLYGNDGDDLLKGGEEDDYLDGGKGDDSVYGGRGVDFLDGRNGNDYLNGGIGRDTLKGGEGDDDIRGDEGSDRLGGDDGDDRLFGGNGNDNLEGNLGDDTLFGGHGTDHIFGGSGNDRLYGENGKDYLEGGDGDDHLRGGNWDDRLFGGDGHDTLLGGTGDDELVGGDGDDRLSGGSGDDTLFGSVGDDYLDGGDGDDLFHFSTPHNVGTTTVNDFTIGEDLIQFSKYSSELTYDDIFLSQEESVAVIQAGETTIRLENVDAEDLSASDFLFG